MACYAYYCALARVFNLIMPANTLASVKTVLAQTFHVSIHIIQHLWDFLNKVA